MMITGIGIIPTWPCPNNLNSSGNPHICLPPDNTYDRPLIIVIVPKVVIKGGISISLIKNAFTMPTRQLINNVMLIANKGGRPDSTMSFAHITLVSDIKDPTDKSIPPVKMTKIIPTAEMPNMEICLKTLNKFSIVKKTGEEIANIIINNINIMAIPYFLIAS